MADGYTFAPGVTAAAPDPGDIFVVVPRSHVFKWIALGEKIIDADLIRRRKAVDLPIYGHAGIASRYVKDTLMVVQAEPHGAEEVPWEPYWGDSVHLWSTGILPPCPPAAKAALKYAGYEHQGFGRYAKVRPGVPYSFLDYQAIAMHHYRIPAPGLQQYIASTGHQICSQLADQCRRDGGSHLFTDGRWPGYVTPLDIGLLLEGIQ